jgi:hypothetical protein
LELHDQVFTWVLRRLAKHGLIRGERIGVDASTTEANAALRAIVRRDSGEGYREMLTRMAIESGIEEPTADDLIRLDRARKDKKRYQCSRNDARTPPSAAAAAAGRRTPMAVAAQQVARQRPTGRARRNRPPGRASAGPAICPRRTQP